MKFNQRVPLKMSALFLAFISVALSVDTSTKNGPEYTEVLHFHYGYLADGTPSHDTKIGEQPKWLDDKLPYELNPDLANELFHTGYKRSKVRKRDFAELDSIFSCEPVEMWRIPLCMPVYRDILIFRKDKEVVKIVQLCFECNRAHFVGPWENVSAFGQRGEYEKLKALLDN